MIRKFGAALILLGVLCVLAAFCLDAKRSPDWMLSCPVFSLQQQNAIPRGISHAAAFAA